MSKERHTTINDLIGGPMGSLQLIIIEPRYTTANFAAGFGQCGEHFAQVFDQLTSGDSCYAGVSELFNVPWYPIGYGDTVNEAIEEAIDRINTIDPKYKREALALVHNFSGSWKLDGSKNEIPVLTGEAW